MKPQAALAAIAALTVAVATTFAPAFAARASYVIDDAHMLSATAIAQINQQVGDLNAQTGKEVLVVTTDSLAGVTPQAAIERSFAQNQVNGVEILIAKSEKQIQVNGDRASRQFFPSGSFSPIVQTMRASFKSGDYDGGVENAVSLIINTYRGHESSLNRGRQPVGAGSTRTQHSSSGGFSMGWIWWIIILAVIFFVIRGIFRAIAGPRMGGGYGPGYGGGGPGYGGGGYGGGFGGGGGGFWSGMLGGLGGAFLGNELFGNRGGGSLGGGGGSDSGG
ncbi:MAG TPA: TPM domain-containing protein, partial [Xanthomonadales bacterium]|nr:TPM domain-containing protein [Xanthomonadales bacterium]